MAEIMKMKEIFQYEFIVLFILFLGQIATKNKKRKRKRRAEENIK